MVLLRLIYIFGVCISSILAACPPGQWRNGASVGSSCLTYLYAVCTTCSAGYYCAGDNTQTACSLYTYSDAGIQIVAKGMIARKKIRYVRK